jgi:hypothetical protein
MRPRIPLAAPGIGTSRLMTGVGGDLGPNRLWLGLSLAAAGIAAVGSIAGLLGARRIYGAETMEFSDQCLAQDAVNLAVVAPLIVVLAIRTARGSARAYVCWLGCLAFTAYSYAIYTFAIHFGPLFLPWLAVLGLSFYALIGSMATGDADVIKSRFSGRALPLTAWTLIGFGILFALLWLNEIVPDLLAGKPSTSAAALRLPTNPVHVLDLALFLPAVLASGTLLLRRAAIGYLTAPGILVFLALTCLPVLSTALVALARDHDPGWGVLLPLGIVLLLASAVLRRTLLALTHPGPLTP